MAFISEYWLNEDGSAPRAGLSSSTYLLDQVYKRMLVSRKYSGYCHDVLDDEDLQAVLASMAPPPFDALRLQRDREAVKAEGVAFGMWRTDMANKVEAMSADRARDASKELLEQTLDHCFRAWLLPEELWSEEARGHGLQHNVSSWPIVQPLAKLVFELCEPRLLALFLPRLGTIVAASGTYVEAACDGAALWHAGDSDDEDDDEDEREGRPATGAADGEAEEEDGEGAVEGKQELRAGKYTHGQLCVWLLQRASGVCAKLKRWNTGVCTDVLQFVGSVLQTQVQLMDVSYAAPETVRSRVYGDLCSPDGLPVAEAASLPQLHVAALQCVNTALTLWIGTGSEAEAAGGTAAGGGCGAAAVRLPTVSVCDRCGAAGTVLFRCGRCQTVYYCSRACQRAGWATHKRQCVAASGQPAAAPPSFARQFDAQTQRAVLAATLHALHTLALSPQAWHSLSVAPPRVLADTLRLLSALGLGDETTRFDTAALLSGADDGREGGVPRDADSAPPAATDATDAGSDDGSQQGREAGGGGPTASSLRAGATAALMIRISLLQQPAASASVGLDLRAVAWLGSKKAALLAAVAAVGPVLEAALAEQREGGLVNSMELLARAVQVADKARAAEASDWVPVNQQILMTVNTAVVSMTYGSSQIVRVRALRALETIMGLLEARGAIELIAKFFDQDKPSLQSHLCNMMLKRMQRDLANTPAAAVPPMPSTPSDAQPPDPHEPPPNPDASNTAEPQQPPHSANAAASGCADTVVNTTAAAGGEREPGPVCVAADAHECADASASVSNTAVVDERRAPAHTSAAARGAPGGDAVVSAADRTPWCSQEVARMTFQRVFQALKCTKAKGRCLLGEGSLTAGRMDALVDRTDAIVAALNVVRFLLLRLGCLPRGFQREISDWLARHQVSDSGPRGVMEALQGRVLAAQRSLREANADKKAYRLELIAVVLEHVIDLLEA